MKHYTLSGDVVPELSPVERVEVLYQALVDHYGEGDERELRAATKLLMVALEKIAAFGGPGAMSLIDEYVDMVRHEPERLAGILELQRRSGIR